MRSREEYAAAAAEGLTMNQAADRLGVTRRIVGYAAKQYGLEFARERAPQVVRRTRDEWVALAEQGLTRKQAAERLGVPVKAVHSAEGRLDIKFKGDPRPAPAAAKPSLTREQQRDVETLMQKAGMTKGDAITAVTAPRRKVPIKVPAQEAARIAQQLRGGYHGRA